MANHSILLVEDNLDFALLLQEALAELQSRASLLVVRNGTELGQFLGGLTFFRSFPNMPQNFGEKMAETRLCLESKK